jgi:hypothetical protein
MYLHFKIIFSKRILNEVHLFLCFSNIIVMQLREFFS